MIFFKGRPKIIILINPRACCYISRFSLSILLGSGEDCKVVVVVFLFVVFVFCFLLLLLFFFVVFFVVFFFVLFFFVFFNNVYHIFGNLLQENRIL